MSQMPPPPGHVPHGASPRVTPASAWVGITLGILSLCTGVTAIFGLVSSVFAMRVIKRDPARYSGSGLAVIGLVTSIIGFFTLFALIGGVVFGFFVFKQVQQLQASNRASQLKWAVDQYAAANDGTFPQPSDHRALLRQHVQWGTPFSEPPPVAMNNAFDSLDRTQTADDRTVLFFEVGEDGPQSGDAKSVTDKPASSSGVLIVYLNGEAELVAHEKVASLKWQPTSGAWTNPMAHMQFNGMTVDKSADDDQGDSASETVDETRGTGDDYTGGKAFYAKKKYAIAAKMFHKFVDENPKDARVGEARYFIARCYESDPDSDRDLAIRAWQTYLEKHAGDDAARTESARKRLQHLTGG